MSYTKFEPTDITINLEQAVSSAWINNPLVNFYTSSIENNQYYLNVYDSANSEDCQFTIQYGHLYGGGSSPINSGVSGISPTRITYGQYRSLIYNDESSSFNFGGTTSEHFFALSVSRSKFKESIKAGSFNLKLVGSTVLNLTDDSITNPSNKYIGTNRYYNIVSGSNGITSNYAINNPNGSYGFVFPDMGLIILNAKSLQSTSANGGIGLSINTNSVSGNPNLTSLFNSIKGNQVNPGSFSLQSIETIASQYLFVRIKNNEFNYTSNPSIINDSGSLLYTDLIDNPQTYITTVGLYDDNNNLLAVAKMSKPLVKDFTKEALLRVKLSY